MKMTLVDCEATLLENIADRRVKRKLVAKLYRLAMEAQRDADERVDWAKVNKAIIDRWSLSALEYIKNLAWNGKCFQ